MFDVVRSRWSDKPCKQDNLTQGQPSLAAIKNLKIRSQSPKLLNQKQKAAYTKVLNADSLQLILDAKEGRLIKID